MNNNPTVSIVLVTWNAERYVNKLMSSFAAQTLQPTKVIIIDNNSTDNTVNLLRENFQGIRIIENRRNLGFSKAYNQGFKMADTDYVLACNQDVILANNFLETIVGEAISSPEAGSVVGKLMKFVLDEEQDSGIRKLDYIDTCGLATTRSRNFYDRGQNQKDTGNYDCRQEIFGPSGALALFKKEALEKTKVLGEFFDEDFFAYKEDVDLAWRLQLAGYKSIYQPLALAWHARTLSKNSKNRLVTQLKRDKFLNYLSYRNHLFLNLKNEFKTNVFKDSIFIFTRQIKNGLFYFIFRPGIFFKTWKSYFSLKKKMKEKRKIRELFTKLSPAQAIKLFRKS